MIRNMWSEYLKLYFHKLIHVLHNICFVVKIYNIVKKIIQALQSWNLFFFFQYQHSKFIIDFWSLWLFQCKNAVIVF